jgi:hypothetical protein
MLTSHQCVFADYMTTWYRDRLVDLHDGLLLHRKYWEYVVITQTLHERGMLTPGRSGVGYAVGLEPLPSVFASKGCTILATDQELDDTAAKLWSNDQWCTGLDALNRRGICDAAAFQARCAFRRVNMAAIPDDITAYDFCWSSCAFEHIGTREDGLDFVVKSAERLRPGGVAAHTTEFSASGPPVVVCGGSAVLYQRADFEALGERLDAVGCDLAPCDWNLGDHPIDSFVDRTIDFSGPFHLKLELDGHETTSYLLIITKRP